MRAAIACLALIQSVVQFYLTLNNFFKTIFLVEDHSRMIDLWLKSFFINKTFFSFIWGTNLKNLGDTN